MQCNGNEEQKSFSFVCIGCPYKILIIGLEYLESSYLEKLWHNQQSCNSVQNSLPGYSDTSLFEQLPGSFLPFSWCSMLALYADRSVNLTLLEEGEQKETQELENILSCTLKINNAS